MNRKHIGADAVYLFPATEDALTIGVLPGVDGGIATALHVETDTLGRFVIPLGAYQLGVIAGVANWLLKLDSDQVADLRARLVRELQQIEGNHNND